MKFLILVMLSMFACAHSQTDLHPSERENCIVFSVISPTGEKHNIEPRKAACFPNRFECRRVKRRADSLIQEESCYQQGWRIESACIAED